jgi:hypothetical protein
MFGLSRLISSHTTLFNLPAKHYSSYQPNKLMFLPPSSPYYPTLVLPSVETTTSGLGGSRQRTSRLPSGSLDGVRRRDAWPRGGGNESRLSSRSITTGLLCIIVLGSRLTVGTISGGQYFPYAEGELGRRWRGSGSSSSGPSPVSPSHCWAPSR